MTTKDSGNYTRFEPWFGAWPPEFKGESRRQKMGDSSSKWIKWWPVLIFLLIALVGGVVVAIWDGWAQDIGIALIIASVIGATIEVTFVTQLAKHVFEIAFGHILSPELQGELRWIYDTSFIAKDYRHDLVLQVEPTNPDVVVAQTTITRTITNISGRTQEVKAELLIPEWFHKEGRSHITSYEITYDGEQFSLANGRVQVYHHTDIDQSNYMLMTKGEKDIKVGSGKSFTWVAKYEEYKRINDECHIFNRITSQGAYVTVCVPDCISYHVMFGHREQPKLESLGNGHYRLPGTLLPWQFIRIRWWRNADAEKWKQEAVN